MVCHPIGNNRSRNRTAGRARYAQGHAAPTLGHAKEDPVLG